MERGERLARMGLQIPAAAQVRVVLCSDVKNEADDAFAVVHHLLTPSFDVRGIIALHFESKSPGSLTTMERSYRGLLELLRITGMEEVPALRGCREPLEHEKDAPESEGVRFLIAEALRPDPRPLYVTVLGALTDVAAAINRCPEIAGRMTVVWIGGGPYPHGMREFNLMQDLPAARAVFVSPVAMWQVPLNVYASMEVTLAELASRVRPCGRAGWYLYRQLEDYARADFRPGNRLHRGENWCLGDQPAVGVLLQCPLRGNWQERPAPRIRDDMTYAPDSGGKSIRVYDSVDPRMILEDFYAKLRLCYGGAD
ncbi:MAG: nucleoside hydrolase [Subdoligranulum variabile]|nr:MAG: nucleoside hydrolase [Subdoligranulum variabile]